MLRHAIGCKRSHGHSVDGVGTLDAGVPREDVRGALVEDEADEEDERAIAHEPRGRLTPRAWSCAVISGHESGGGAAL
eukprot:scaffold40579_cov48-Phaeocystis_antarctica.AAC.1